MRLVIEVWRQDGPEAAGRFDRHDLDDATEDMSILELLDRLNALLVETGRDPVAFDHDCREGICGSCGMMVNGRPHGPLENTPACLQRVRSFSDGDVVRLEPFRARAFPVVRDLVVDRSSLDRILVAGGYVSANTASAPEAASIPVNHAMAEAAMDFAACIGCGACVAACPNAAAQLFTGAKVAHLGSLPQGQVERYERVRDMVDAMEAEFGSCTNYAECVPACPADVPILAIAELNRERRRSLWAQRKTVDPQRSATGWLARLRTGPWKEGAEADG